MLGVVIYGWRRISIERLASNIEYSMPLQVELSIAEMIFIEYP
jgi:hypothetical protein